MELRSTNIEKLCFSKASCLRAPLKPIFILLFDADWFSVKAVVGKMQIIILNVISNEKIDFRLILSPPCSNVKLLNLTTHTTFINNFFEIYKSLHFIFEKISY